MLKLHRLILLIIITGFLPSCHNSTKKIDEIGEDEKQIITIVFDKIVGPDSLMKKHLLPIEYLPKGGFQSAQEKSDHLFFLKEIDSIKSKLDTSKLYILINDSLIRYPKGPFPILLDFNDFKMNNKEIDTSFYPLVLKLVDSTYSTKLDKSHIKSKYNYQIEYKNKSMKDKCLSEIKCFYNKYSIFVIGYVNISRATFNKNKTKACIYASFQRGPLNGIGTVFFLEKENKTWIIKGSGYGWIS